MPRRMKTSSGVKIVTKQNIPLPPPRGKIMVRKNGAEFLAVSKFRFDTISRNKCRIVTAPNGMVLRKELQNARAALWLFKKRNPNLNRNFTVRVYPNLPYSFGIWRIDGVPNEAPAQPETIDS